MLPSKLNIPHKFLIQNQNISNQSNLWKLFIQPSFIVIDPNFLINIIDWLYEGKIDRNLFEPI